MVKEYPINRSGGGVSFTPAQKTEKTQVDKKDINIIIKKIKTGKITKESQIPSNLRKHINLPKDTFKKKSYEINKSGGQVKLNPIQEAIARDLARSAIENRHTSISSPGKNRNVWKRASFLLGESRKKSYLANLTSMQNVAKIQKDKIELTTYITPSGNLMSIDPEKASTEGFTPVNVEITGGKYEVPKSEVTKKIKEKTASKKLFGTPAKSELFQPSDVSKETSRYEKLGFEREEAEVLAKESVSRGGVTFTPKESEKIIKKAEPRGAVGRLAEKSPAAKKVSDFLYGVEDKYKKWEGSAGELPYGLQPKPEYQKGKEFSPFYTHMWLGRKVGGKPKKETYVSPLTIQKRTIISGENITDSIPPIMSPDWLTSSVAETPKFYFFSPFMKTAASKKAAKTKQETKLVKYKRHFKTSDTTADDIADALARKSKKEIGMQLKKWATQIKTSSGAKKEIAIRNMEKILSSMYRKGLIKDFVFNQETGIFNVMGVVEPKNVYLAYTPPPTLKKLPEVSITAKAIGERRISFTGDLPKAGMESFTLPTTKKTKTSVMTGWTSKMLGSTKTKRKTKQKQVVRTKQGSITKQFQLQGQAIKQIQVQKQRPRYKQATDFLSPSSTQYKPPKPKKVVPLPGFFDLDWDKPKRSKRISKKKSYKRRKAYQPSVSSFILGYEATPKQVKKLQKQKFFSGAEIRPLFPSKKKKRGKKSFTDIILG